MAGKNTAVFGIYPTRDAADAVVDVHPPVEVVREPVGEVVRR